jgi:hypothetical protein
LDHGIKESGQIHTVIDAGQLQLGLFDQRNLFEVSNPDFPGERLMPAAIRSSRNCVLTNERR